jgi:enoyl-CoA hydratase
MKTYKTLSVVKRNQVATVTMYLGRELAPEKPSRAKSPRPRAPSEPASDLAAAMMALRQDDSVRVVVLTGSDGQFKIPNSKAFYHEKQGRVTGLADPTAAWRVFSAIIRCHQTMAEMEKPIIAKVNGDAIGFGSSLAFACDIIVADEKAKFMDHHMGGVFTSNYGGRMMEGGHDFSTVPGDGGLSLMPLFMSPCRAKEYLMLAQPYEARELDRLGIINYAVPANALDAKVADIVERLLARGAYALAMAKRVANRGVVDQLNKTLDAGIGYEMVSFLQLARWGGKDKRTLD